MSKARYHLTAEVAMTARDGTLIEGKITTPLIDEFISEEDLQAGQAQTQATLETIVEQFVAEWDKISQQIEQEVASG